MIGLGPAGVAGPVLMRKYVMQDCLSLSTFTAAAYILRENHQELFFRRRNLKKKAVSIFVFFSASGAFPCSRHQN